MKYIELWRENDFSLRSLTFDAGDVVQLSVCRLLKNQAIHAMLGYHVRRARLQRKGRNYHRIKKKSQSKITPDAVTKWLVVRLTNF